MMSSRLVTPQELPPFGILPRLVRFITGEQQVHLRIRCKRRTLVFVVAVLVFQTIVMLAAVWESYQHHTVH